MKELSDRRQQDPQQTPAKARDISDSPRPLTGTSETLQESSPPRFSQLVGTLPEPNPSRSRPSTATNSAALVNHPDTTSNHNNGTGQVPSVTVGFGGAHNAPTIQDRNQTQLAPDRRHSTLYYDPIRGESPTNIYASDDGEHDRRFPPTRTNVPRPRPVFNVQDGTVNGGGSRGSPRGISGPDLFQDPQEPTQPVRSALRFHSGR